MRTAEEVEALSRTFSADWRAGDQIMTWLKRHEGKTQELSNLVRDGWSWTDVGRAMAVAGIHYRFGEPMSAAILRKKASEVRAAVRNRNAGTSQDSATIKAPADPAPGSVDVEFWTTLQQKQAAIRAAQVAVARTGPAKNEEPEFRPAKLANHWSGTKIVREGVKPPDTIPPPAQPPTSRADEVIARLLGKPLPPPAAAAATIEDKVQTSEEGPVTSSPGLNSASLVLAAGRLLKRTRAALR